MIDVVCSAVGVLPLLPARGQSEAGRAAVAAVTFIVGCVITSSSRSTVIAVHHLPARLVRRSRSRVLSVRSGMGTGGGWRFFIAAVLLDVSVIDAEMTTNLGSSTSWLKNIILLIDNSTVHLTWKR